MLEIFSNIFLGFCTVCCVNIPFNYKDSHNAKNEDINFSTIDNIVIACPGFRLLNVWDNYVMRV